MCVRQVCCNICKNIIASMFCQEISETILSCSQTQAEKRCEEKYCLIYPEDSCSGGFMEFSDQ